MLQTGTFQSRDKYWICSCLLVPWVLSFMFLAGGARPWGPLPARPAGMQRVGPLMWDPVVVEDEYWRCLTAFQADIFSCVLVQKMEYFEWNKEKSVLRQIHFFCWMKWKLPSWIVCLPTSPTGFAQSKSSAASGRKGGFRRLLLQWVTPQGKNKNKFPPERGVPNCFSQENILL